MVKYNALDWTMMICPIFKFGAYLLRYEGAVVKGTTEGLVVHNAADQLLIILDIHCVLENRSFFGFRLFKLALRSIHCIAGQSSIHTLLAQDFCSIFH